MELLKDVECNVNRQIGGKAKNLFKLMKLGFNVPKWIVIPESVFNEFLPNSNKELTTEAKLLYGLLLDRNSLSAKNNWIDDDNKIFIHFSCEFYFWK